MSFRIKVEHVEIQTDSVDDLMKLLRLLPFAETRPKDAPVLNRAPVSQHIEPSLPVGGKPQKKTNGLFKCSKCGATDFANPQSLSRHENRCDGTDRSADSRKAQREWKARKTAKANGTAKGDYPCPVSDCAFGPFSTAKGLSIHNGRFHPEMTA